MSRYQTPQALLSARLENFDFAAFPNVLARGFRHLNCRKSGCSAIMGLCPKVCAVKSFQPIQLVGGRQNSLPPWSGKQGRAQSIDGGWQK